jgi:O-antigen/teichoic acid export membrane protein
MSIVFSQKFILDGTTKISFYGTLVGAAMNILLNFWLLPLYGAYGAAAATVISYLIPMIFQTVFFDKQIGLIFMEAVASPVIYMKRFRGNTWES